MEMFAFPEFSLRIGHHTYGKVDASNGSVGAKRVRKPHQSWSQASLKAKIT